jgi:hypothetical protein
MYPYLSLQFLKLLYIFHITCHFVLLFVNRQKSRSIYGADNKKIYRSRSTRRPYGNRFIHRLANIDKFSPTCKYLRPLWNVIYYRRVYKHSTKLNYRRIQRNGASAAYCIIANRFRPRRASNLGKLMAECKSI